MNSNIDQKEYKKTVDWKSTVNFKNGIYGSLYPRIEQICGEKTFGKGKSRAKVAYKLTQEYLDKISNMEVFHNIPTGKIITTPPTQEECITKMTNLGNRSIKYYSKITYPQTDITDSWANAAGVHEGESLNWSNPRHMVVLQRCGKRFVAREISTEETVRDIITDCRGMLAEGHVIAFLNSEFCCPECKKVGQIGWCDGISHRSVDAFRDAVCLGCQKNGIITLFEIKTRWESAIAKAGMGTYTGSFAALNTLMAMKANIYLAIAARDTGIVRVGKVTSAYVRGNKNWLYALQEGLTWGSPSSFVKCEHGLWKCPVTMPPLIETLDDTFIKNVSDAALKNIGLEE